MRRLVLLTVALLLVAACSSGDDDATKAAGGATPTTGAQAWAEAAAAGVDTHSETIDGELVLVAADDEVVYVQDCDVARKITSEGGKYGPTPRNEDGTGGAAGYAFVCDD